MINKKETLQVMLHKFKERYERWYASTRKQKQIIFPKHILPARWNYEHT